MTTTIPILSLKELTSADAGRAGRKAATLGELLAAGFPVPDGFVLTSEVVSQLLRQPLPDELAETLVAGLAAMGDPALAVRSSGVDEDLAGASYAGQYETVLDVHGIESLVSAVRTCWASASSARVEAYQQAHGRTGVRPMAVLVQRMVPAQAAGVAFSANPVTGERGEVMLSAVRGLGDRLAAGQQTPEEWVLPDPGAHAGADAAARCRSGAQNALTTDQAQAVAALVRRVQAHVGAPQDIEWALSDGRVWLLQARPITALPAPGTRTAEVPPGFWQRDGYCPRPWSPMHRSVALPALETALKHLFTYGTGDGLRFAEINGWMYTRFVPLATSEQVQARIQHIVAASRADEPGRTVRRWYDEWQPTLTAQVARLRAVDLASLADDGLIAHLHAVQTLAEQVQEVHCRVGASGAYLLGELGVLCRDLLGWDAHQVLRLLTGLPGKTTEPAFRLAELGRLARSKPAVTNLLAHPGADTADLLAADTECRNAFLAYQQEYTHRAMSADLTEPTLAERPALVLTLLRDQLAHEFDPAAHAAALQRERAAVVADARASLTRRPVEHGPVEHGPVEHSRFERALTRAQHAYPVREDTMFCWSAAWALVRYTVLELGRRLAERGQLARGDDVFFLTAREAGAALADRGARHTLVTPRAAQRAWAEAHPGPASYGELPPTPPGAGDRRAVGPEARHALEVGMWAWAATSGQLIRPRSDRAPGADLRGVGACAGRYTGPVCLITDETEFGKLRPGDVLVCPETTAAWSVLFPSVGALITDTGGLLSHPAIIAREYRLPAVLATGNATRRLRDGQLVTVDGSTGTVQFAAWP